MKRTDMGTLRKYLIAGLLVWLPLGATVVIVKLVIDLLDRTILLLPPEWQPETVLGFSIPGFGIILSVAILLLTGMLAANLFGRRFVEFWESLVGRIPLIRTIYKSVKQIVSTILTSDSSSFRKVVMIEYPRKGLWSLGFLTNDTLNFECDRLGDDYLAVFVPTTPNPTSGYIIIVSRSDVIELQMTVEEGFKFIISMGVIIPADPIRERLVANKVALKTTDS